MTKFQPGFSGNPQGRPRGSVSKQLAALREAADKILPLVLQRALDGCSDAQRLILDKALPRMKPMSPAEPFTLPDGDLLSQVQAMLRQTANGELSPSIAAEVVGMVATAAKVEETDSLRAELNTLKQALETRARRKYERNNRFKKTI
jgi:hypothetical protein